MNETNYIKTKSCLNCRRRKAYILDKENYCVAYQVMAPEMDYTTIANNCNRYEFSTEEVNYGE